MTGENGDIIPASSIYNLSHMVTMLAIVHYPIEMATRYQGPDGFRAHVETLLRECPGQVSRHLRELSETSVDGRFGTIADRIDEYIIEYNIRRARSGSDPHPSPEL